MRRVLAKESKNRNLLWRASGGALVINVPPPREAAAELVIGFPGGAGTLFWKSTVRRVLDQNQRKKDKV